MTATQTPSLASTRPCPDWCTTAGCYGDHAGEVRVVHAGLYDHEVSERTEVFVAPVQEDMAGSRPGASLSIGEFTRNAATEKGMSVFLTVDQLRELRDATQRVLDELESAKGIDE